MQYPGDGLRIMSHSLLRAAGLRRMWTCVCGFAGPLPLSLPSPCPLRCPQAGTFLKLVRKTYMGRELPIFHFKQPAVLNPNQLPFKILRVSHLDMRCAPPTRRLQRHHPTAANPGLLRMIKNQRGGGAAVRGKGTCGGRPGQRVEEQGTWVSRTRKRGRVWTA